ncbi:cytochrome P450 [Artomyces pyxidatus]|uniref:Cytochrome P450 n=1 Tax=Artomyces pyxidatus TaxID=48021 RepID=A0ACB8T2Y7_9AGAM|nr:cytochrome P450 [Artomyces pyxidatus]
MESVPAAIPIPLRASGALNSTELPASYVLFGFQQNKVLGVGLLAALVVLLASRYIASPRRKLPPGPRGLPILGNALSLRKSAWLTFTEWKKTYGDVMYLTALGQPILVLNSQKAAADLLDRRSALYSNRPHNIVAAGMLTGGLFMVFQHYTSLWRRMRKAAHEGLGRGIADPFNGMQLTEAVHLTRSMMRDPNAWKKHFHRTASSTVMSVIYDTPIIESEYDQRVKSVDDFVHRLERSALPGAHLVEFMPWMMYIPSRFAKWKRDARAWYAKDSTMFEKLFKEVGDSLGEDGTDRPSVAATLFKNAKRNDLSLRENAWLAATLYSAGGDTTATVLEWWLLAMLVYPETQRRAQAELDAVVGRNRIPTFADMQDLPYIRAMVKEALRWRPTGPLGLPHRVMEDDWYEGMFIPAGTIVIGNVWALNRDPELYGADAEHYNPARFIDEKGALLPGPPETKEEGHFTYGFGRRVCVGKHIANSSMFMDMALMLWACKFEHAKDAEGRQVPIDAEGWVEDGLIIRPLPFQCSVTPRFPEATAILSQEYELRSEL